jgi:hypothetical protein
VDAAVAALREAGEGARLVRAWIPRPTYYVLAPGEDPASIPLLRRRKGTRAEVVAVLGANGHVRPDSLREVPVGSAVG